MAKNTPVSTIMTACPVVGNPSTKFSQILRLFTEFAVHHLPIVDDDNKLIGIVSSNDLPKVFLTLCHRAEPVMMSIDVLDKEVIVADLMTANPVTIGSGEPVIKAIEIFAEKKFMALPVVDNGTLVGILSIKDVVAYEEAVA